jgi:hypothetical protein
MTELPHKARRVDPFAARDQQSEPFQRARDELIVVQEGDVLHRATVQVGDGDRHDVALVEDQEGYVGYCDCDGFAFHEGDLAGDCCTHIIALVMKSIEHDSLVTTLDDVVEPGGSPVDASDQDDEDDVEIVDVEGETPGDDRGDHGGSPTPEPSEPPTRELDDPFAGALKDVDDRFVMTLGGDPYIKREGFQRLARREGYRVETEMRTWASDTDNELAEARAVVRDQDGDVVATGTGTAYAPDEDLAGAEGNLNELAETRALSRAMGWATGAGLSAVEVDASAEYDDGARADGGRE